MDNIEVLCKCGLAFLVKPQAVGRSVRCPKCQAPNQIQAPSKNTPKSPTASWPPQPPQHNPEPELEWDVELGEYVERESKNSPKPPASQPEPPASPPPPIPEPEHEHEREVELAEHVDRKPGQKERGPSIRAKSTMGNIPPPRRYIALEAVASLYQILVMLIGVFWLLISLMLLVVAIKEGVSDTSFENFVKWIFSSIGVMFLATFLWATAEGIKLAIDIQSNTYDAAYKR